jgi:hypothetical protein
LSNYGITAFDWLVFTNSSGPVWAIGIETAKNATPGTYNLPVHAQNATTGKIAFSNITIALNPPSNVYPDLAVQKMVYVAKGGSALLTGTYTGASQWGYNVNYLAGSGVNVTEDPTLIKCTNSICQFGLWLNAPVNAVPGNYIFALNAENVSSGNSAYSNTTIVVVSSPQETSTTTVVPATTVATCDYGYVCGNSQLGCAVEGEAYNCPNQTVTMPPAANATSALATATTSAQTTVSTESTTTIPAASAGHQSFVSQIVSAIRGLFGRIFTHS